MSKYDAGSITWVKGADAIRLNPSLYLGASNSIAVTHLAKEVIANSIDEAAAGFGDTIIISVNHTSKRGASIIVADNGRGIPVGKHPKHPDRNTLRLVFEELHTGGKTKNSEGYEGGSLGVHGLGLSAVNALSSNVRVWSKPKITSEWYHASFKNGVSMLKAVGGVCEETPPAIKGFDYSKTGTIIEFSPDLSYFDDGSSFDTDMLLDWVDSLSWFVTNNTISRGKIVRKPVKFILRVDGTVYKFHRESLIDFYRHTISSNKLDEVDASIEPFVLQTDSVDVLIGWAADDKSYFNGYCNGALNENGGTHVAAITKLIVSTVKTYAKKSQTFKPADLLSGAIGCVNVRIKAPQFDSQSKTRLVSKTVEPLIEKAVTEAFAKWAKKHKTYVKILIERATAISSATESAKKDRKLAAALKIKSKGKSLLPKDLIVSSTKKPDERELFLVEGLSAGGSASKASDRHFQEILCLRGKVLNVVKDADKAASSQAIIDILQAIGYNAKSDDQKLRVGKVILTADADADGQHISALLISLFWQLLPSVFEEGRIYNANPPLFVHQNSKGSKVYAMSMEELKKKVPKLDASRVTRMKGLGEMSPDALAETVFNRKTRKLTKITPEVAKGYVSRLMGDDVNVRKQLLGL